MFGYHTTTAIESVLDAAACHLRGDDTHLACQCVVKALAGLRASGDDLPPTAVSEDAATRAVFRGLATNEAPLHLVIRSIHLLARVLLSEPGSDGYCTRSSVQVQCSLDAVQVLSAALNMWRYVA